MGAAKLSELEINASTYLKKTLGKNLLDKDAITQGYFFGEHGDYIELESYGYSDYIEVHPSSKYTLSGVLATGSYHCFYDKDGAFISSVKAGSSSSQTLESPSNAKYLRISVSIGSFNTAQVEYGETATSYQAYNPTFNSDVKMKKINVSANDKYIVSKKGKNLLNPDAFIVGEWVMEDGYIGKVGYGIGRTEFIPIKEGESLTCSSKSGFLQCRAALYDRNFIPIKGTF